MTTTARVLAFGFVTGLIWSAALLLIFGYDVWPSDVVTVFVSGILSGMLVSLTLRVSLVKLGRIGVAGVGLLSLPLGAFFFGFFAEAMELVFNSSGKGFNPLCSGLFYAGASIFAFYFFPPAILTTFLLRAVIRAGAKSNDVP